MLAKVINNHGFYKATGKYIYTTYLFIIKLLIGYKFSNIIVLHIDIIYL